MDFFSRHGGGQDGPRAEPPPRPAWTGPPEDSLGHVVGVNAVVVRTSNVVVVVQSLIVHSEGVSIDLRVAGRRGDWSRERWDEAVEAVLGFEIGRRTSSAGDLLVGVSLPDGRSAVADAFLGRWDEREPAAPLFVKVNGGGSSGDRRFDSDRAYWLWPQTDAAEFELVFAWPAFDVSELRFPLSVDLSLGAGARSLWS